MIRLLLVDDHQLFRAGLRCLVDGVPGLTVVGEAESGEGALALARELNPDVIVMDVMMPGIGGLEATRRLTRFDRPPRVLALSSCVEPPFPAQMLRAGATGYASKNISPDELITAIKRVYIGHRYLSHDIAQDLASYAFEDKDSSPFDSLSHREMQIMMMVINCHKVRDISNRLHLSPKTVNSYRYRIFDKLRVHSDVELVLLAVKYGMIKHAQDKALGAGSHGPAAATRHETFDPTSAQDVA